MKKIKLFTLALIATMGFCACNNEENGSNGLSSDAVLCIYPSISRSSVSRAVNIGEKSEWSADDEIGLFVTSGTFGSSYLEDTKYDNVKYTFSQNNWKGASDVLLSTDKASIFAYYPYTASLVASAMPILVESQRDVLYGKGIASVDFQNRNVEITMKHALTQFVIFLKKGDYEGAGKVTSIKLLNKHDKKNLVSGGTMNIGTGVITPSEAADYTFPDNDITLGDEVTTLNAFLVPVASTAALGDIQLQITIDDHDFYYDFKEGTTWAAGYKNSYSTAVNSNSLEINQADISIEPWNKSTDMPTVDLTPMI